MQVEVADLQQLECSQAVLGTSPALVPSLPVELSVNFLLYKVLMNITIVHHDFIVVHRWSRTKIESVQQLSLLCRRS
jgi:hypothetical protein